MDIYTDIANDVRNNTYKQKFNSDAKARRYSTRHLNSNKGKRERNCIKRALADVEKNSLVLDLPCGTGRLSYYLKELGFYVIGADYSIHMLYYAKKNLVGKSTNYISFEQQDIFAIQHPNNTFSATVCNRLFHHYPTAELRRSALKELARVTDGPIIVSFFNSNSISALINKFKNFLLKKKPQDRFSVSLNTFKKDVKSAGLVITDCFYTRFGISPQMYVKLRKM